MNLIEAVKSGEPIERSSWTHGHYITEQIDGIFRYEDYGSDYVFTAEDLVADDWEIFTKPIKTVIVSRDRLRAAIAKCKHGMWLSHIEELERHLGLE